MSAWFCWTRRRFHGSQRTCGSSGNSRMETPVARPMRPANLLFLQASHTPQTIAEACRSVPSRRGRTKCFLLLLLWTMAWAEEPSSGCPFCSCKCQFLFPCVALCKRVRPGVLEGCPAQCSICRWQAHGIRPSRTAAQQVLQAWVYICPHAEQDFAKLQS